MNQSKLTIHQVYVKVQDQPQADRLKAVCEKYGLPIPRDSVFHFYYPCKNQSVFAYSDSYEEFYVYSKDGLRKNKTPVTEPQFIALCEEWVKENNK